MNSAAVDIGRGRGVLRESQEKFQKRNGKNENKAKILCLVLVTSINNNKKLTMYPNSQRESEHFALKFLPLKPFKTIVSPGIEESMKKMKTSKHES